MIHKIKKLNGSAFLSFFGVLMAVYEMIIADSSAIMLKGLALFVLFGSIFIFSVYRTSDEGKVNLRKIRFAPLNSGFMAFSILGILISVIYLRAISIDWATASTLIFTIMFMASVVSMTVADPDEFVEIEKKK